MFFVIGSRHVEEQLKMINDFFCNGVNKLWDINGDEGCGQVSSKLCVWFLRRIQMHIVEAIPT